MNIESIDDIIDSPYAWPGGYLKVAITSDGGILCPNCIKENRGLILDSINTNTDDGWRVEAIDIHHHTEEDPYPCDHCGQDINEM